MAEEVRKDLKDHLDFVEKLDLNQLKYEISSELGSLTEEVSELIDEAEKKEVRIPPRIRVRITGNKMEAYIKVVTPGKPIPITEEDIRKSLKDNGVEKGILEKSIEEILVEKIIDQEVLIARGQPTVNGKDGYMKPLQVLRKEKPEECVDARGKVDFKRMRLGNIVEAGEVVAEKFPPTSGKDGYDVTGKFLPAKPGKEIDFSLTPDVGISPTNERELVALKNGVLKKDFTIDEINFIKGDVDFTTGNISYPKSLVVTGDVKSGFSVYCGENIEIRGCVEDSEVVADGDVLIKQGFLGTGKGLVKGRNVTIGHIKQQKVIASGDINIGGEVIHGMLQADGFIKMLSVRGIVIGGTLIAGKGIEVINAGNARNVKTTLKVGYSEEAAKIEEQIGKLEKNIEKVESARRIITVAGEFKELPEEKKQLSEKLKETKKHLALEKNALKTRRINIIEELLEEDKPYVKVVHTIFPNTTIQIGHLKMPISKEMRNKRFCVVKNKIFVGT